MRSRASLFAVTLLALLLAPPAQGAGARVFQDPLGDVNCCTRDVTDVRVANNDAGTITFTIQYDATYEQGDDDDFFLTIDTARGRYVISAHVGLSFADSITMNERTTDDVHVTATGDRLIVSLDRHLLGDADAFSFGIAFWEVTSFGGANSEVAPNGGSWAFRVRIALPRLQPVLRTEQPAPGRFVARLGLRVRGTSSWLASGRIRCGASAGGRALPLSQAEFVDRRAVCTWRLPRWAIGKILRGSIGVAVTSGATISRRFTRTL